MMQQRTTARRTQGSATPASARSRRRRATAREEASYLRMAVMPSDRPNNPDQWKVISAKWFSYTVRQ